MFAEDKTLKPTSLSLNVLRLHLQSGGPNEVGGVHKKSGFILKKTDTYRYLGSAWACLRCLYLQVTGGPSRKKGELGGTDRKMSHRSTKKQPAQSLGDQAGPENDHQVDFQMSRISQLQTNRTHESESVAGFE